MKRLVLALAIVGAIVVSSMTTPNDASAGVSPEKQAVMNAEGYTLETHVESVPPTLDKYCPGPKKTRDVGRRLRNSNRATMWRLWFRATECYNNKGERSWHKINAVRFATPSVYWDRAFGPKQSWKRGTAWSQMLIMERVPGDDPLAENRLWDLKLFINFHFENGGIWVSKGFQLR